MTPLFTITQIRQIIAESGPLMKLHAEERYLMDHPDRLLGTGRNKLQWAIVRGDNDYDSFSEEGLQSRNFSDAVGFIESVAIAKSDPRSSDINFRYWLSIDQEDVHGSQNDAKALVCIRQRDQSFVDLQFFYFYGFNGPGKFRVSLGAIEEDFNSAPVGQHFGDIEHVTLRVAPTTEAGLTAKVVAIYLSRHNQTHWISDLSQITWEGYHPVIYVARDSHAHYETAGKHYYERVKSIDVGVGTLAVDLFDIADDGGHTLQTWDPGKSQIVFSNVESHEITCPIWWDYAGRWGQYVKQAYTFNFAYIYAYTFKEVAVGPGAFTRFENDAETFAMITATKAFDRIFSSIEAFGIGRNKSIYHTRLDSDGWHPWEGNFKNGPEVQSIVQVFKDSLEVFAIGVNGILHRNYLDLYNGWHDWTIFSDKHFQSITTAQKDHLELFGIDSDGIVYHNYRDPSGWHQWEVFIGNNPIESITTSLSTTISRGDRLEVFALGKDRLLYNRYLDRNGWQPIQNLGGNIHFKSITCGTSDRGIALFGIDLEGTLYYNYQDMFGAWHQWENIGQGTPFLSVVVERGFNFEIFGIGLDGMLYHNYLDKSGWHKWEIFNGTLRFKSLTTAVSPFFRPSHIELFALGVDGFLYHKWLDEHGWHPLWNMGGDLRFKSVTTALNDNLELFGIGLDGTLYHNYLDRSGWHNWVGPFTG